MAAIERGPSIPGAVRMIYPLPPGYKARLEAISVRERKTVAHITTLAMMELIDRLDPQQPAILEADPGKKPKARKKSDRPS